MEYYQNEEFKNEVKNLSIIYSAHSSLHMRVVGR
jgi:hypothetical protein